MPIVPTSAITRDLLDSLTASEARAVIGSVGAAKSLIKLGGLVQPNNPGIGQHLISDDAGHSPCGVTGVTAPTTDSLRVSFDATYGKVCAGYVSAYRNLYGIQPFVSGIGISALDIGYRQIAQVSGRIWYDGAAWQSEGSALAASPFTWDAGTKTLVVNHLAAAGGGLFYHTINSLSPVPILTQSTDADIRPVFVRQAAGVDTYKFGVRWIDDAGLAQDQSAALGCYYFRSAFTDRLLLGTGFSCPAFFGVDVILG